MNKKIDFVTLLKETRAYMIKRLDDLKPFNKIKVYEITECVQTIKTINDILKE